MAAHVNGNVFAGRFLLSPRMRPKRAASSRAVKPLQRRKSVQPHGAVEHFFDKPRIYVARYLSLVPADFYLPCAFYLPRRNRRFFYNKRRNCRTRQRCKYQP
jgi:hypothetical protein